MKIAGLTMILALTTPAANAQTGCSASQQEASGAAIQDARISVQSKAHLFRNFKKTPEQVAAMAVEHCEAQIARIDAGCPAHRARAESVRNAMQTEATNSVTNLRRRLTNSTPIPLRQS
jgi:hypothetical protein